MLKLLDASHYQKITSYDAIKTAGYDGIIFKASDGLKVDPTFQDNIKGAIAAGLVAGAYHFGRPLIDWMEQLKIFRQQIDQAGVPMLMALDVEEVANDSHPQEDWAVKSIQENSAGVESFLDGLIEAYRKKPILYIGPRFADKYLSMLALASYFIWVAKYSQIPPDWNILIWQKSPAGKVPGIEGDVDLDVFYGELQDLQAMVGH